MSERIHALAQRLFGKATIEECNLEEVKSLVQRFPYFAPAQFLLLEKLKQQGAEEYSTQLQKSILYYPNPLEFQYFMASERFYTEVDLEEPAERQQATSDEPQVASGEKEEDSIETGLPVATTEPGIAGEEMGTALSNEPQTVNIELQTSNLEPQTSNIKPEPEFTFEPYHTVDYFASQGIKLSQEEVSKDKFGKQLKSFTEWLKTMKRLPATQMAATVDSGSETKVQHLAQDSIHEADVYTEAMAEVWAKQGNTQKAIEIYNKLVLLNPSKKAYFATKIENLKQF